MSRRAKIISDQQLNELLARLVSDSREPLRDYAIVLLSFKAGLRAAEIAGLEWSDVTDATGCIGQIDPITNERVIAVPSSIAKKGRYRTVPLHPALEATLGHLKMRLFGNGFARGHVIRGAAGCASITPNALQRYLSRLYKEHGLDCTSHSGRRTMITKMAQIANKHDCSLMDVQRVAGHSRVDTTEAYVEHSLSVHRLVEAI